jgi:ethanolamine ammonia-lyase small subunit
MPGATLFVLCDGLSATAVQRHAVPLLRHVIPRLSGAIAPIVVAEQGRVALGDDIGEAMGAAAVAVLIGERPGLSAADSLGVYLTWQPRRGRTDAERNCISNIRPEGLTPEFAADKLLWLIDAMRRMQLTGIALKDEHSQADVATLEQQQIEAEPP